MTRSAIGLFFLALSACTTPSIVANQSIQNGDVANNQNKYDDAIKYYEQYLSLSPQLGLYRNPRMEAEVGRKLAHAYATQGKYAQSIKYLRKAITIDSVNGHMLEFVDDYRQLGMVLGFAGDYHAARRHLQKSLSLNEGLEYSLKEIKRSAAADTYLSLAQLEMTLGNFKEARVFAWKALEIYSNIPGEFEGSIEATLILGIIERETGNYSQSERFIKQSEELSKKNNLSVGRHAQALSEIYFSRGDPENGIRYKVLALEEARRINIKPQIINAYMRLGDGYQRLGDKIRANFYYRKALSVQAEMEGDSLSFTPSLNMRFGDAHKAYDYHLQSGSTTGLALVSLRLGEQYFQKNELDSSFQMYEQAKKSFTKSGSVEGIAKASLELAKVCIIKKLFAEADELLRESNRLTVQPDLKWQIFLRKGMIKENIGAFDSALHCYKKAIAIINEMRGNITIEEFKTLFTDTKVEVYDKVILLLLRNYTALTGYTYERAVKESFEYSEQSRSRTFLDMLGNRKIEPKNGKDGETLEREQLLKLKIQRLSKELNNVQPHSSSWQQFSDELVNAQNEYDNLIHKLKLNNEAYSTIINVEPPSLADIQARLNEQTALLEYWVSQESLIIWTISKNKITSALVPLSRKTLQREIIAFRNIILLHLTDSEGSRLKKLSEVLISPVQQTLAVYKYLVIIPHKDLHFMPFHALEVTPNKFLMEQHIISYAPSASILHHCLGKTINPGKRLLSLALGDMAIGNFSGLPGTELEVNQLAELYLETDSKMKEACTETYLKVNGSTQNYIHLATHGVFNKMQPLYSYLLMSPSEQDDGRLTVDEIFAMELQAKFVTLSACETGLGDLGEGDDLVGLSRAFIYAGTPGVIVSLWKVDDASTAWLMTRFHQYINAGNNASESLTYAQRDLIQRNFDPSAGKGLKSVKLSDPLKQVAIMHNNISSRDPYYWAPFVIMGNGFVR